MSNLEELIERLCPDGVEYKEINDCTIKVQNIKWKSYVGEDKQYIDLSSVDRERNIITETQNINADTAPSRAQQIVMKDDIILGTTRPMLKRYCIIPEKYDGEICSTGFCVLRAKTDIINPRWLYHNITTKKFFAYVEKNQQGASYPAISDTIVKAFMLPVPPLEVQREIVRILDNFTFLTTELAAELAARQKQYEFYRDFLLNFNDGCEEEINGNVRLMKLGELGKWSGGKTPSMAEKSFWENGSIPWISSKDMKFNTLLDTQDHITQKALIEASMTLYPANSIAVVTRSGILKHTFPVAYIPFPTTINQDIKILVVNDEILPRYAFHVIQSKGKDILEKTKKQGGTVDSLDFQKVLAFKVLVPTKSIQQKLVDKLDCFDALCHDISSGLPAEIEMRQKQYEYYRDKLLTFKELKKEA